MVIRASFLCSSAEGYILFHQFKNLGLKKARINLCERPKPFEGSSIWKIQRPSSRPRHQEQFLGGQSNHILVVQRVLGWRLDKLDPSAMLAPRRMPS
jgi:hypothetical protein